MDVNLSLCCISNILAEQNVKFRTMTYKTFMSKDKKESLDKLTDIIINNFSVTSKIIRHCHSVGIKGYRLSSDLCPVINHPDVMMKLEDLPDYDMINNEINNVKSAIVDTGIRLSAHPSEYISLTSDDAKTISNSIVDLEFHAEIFDRLNLSQSYYNPLNIHCRKDGEPNLISSKFMKNFDKLSDSVKNRLVIENNDNSSGVWSIKNLHMFFHKSHKIPVTFDNLHHKMLSDGLSEEEAFTLAYETWPVEPIFHYSEGKNNTRAHCDMAEGLPNSYSTNVMFEVELKSKDMAILDILQRSQNARESCEH